MALVSTPVSLGTRLRVKNTRDIFKVCCTVHEGHKRPKRGVPNVANTRGARRGSGGDQRAAAHFLLFDEGPVPVLVVVVGVVRRLVVLLAPLLARRLKALPARRGVVRHQAERGPLLQPVGAVVRKQL
eukprot:720749-Prorocentrum_minimum.AAC.1